MTFELPISADLLPSCDQELTRNVTNMISVIMSVLSGLCGIVCITCVIRAVWNSPCDQGQLISDLCDEAAVATEEQVLADRFLPCFQVFLLEVANMQNCS